MLLWEGGESGGLALTTIRSTPLRYLWKLLLAGGNCFSPAHLAASWLSTDAFLPAALSLVHGAIFGSQRAATSFSYDARNRVTLKSYSGVPSTPAVTYCYDQERLLRRSLPPFRNESHKPLETSEQNAKL